MRGLGLTVLWGKLHPSIQQPVGMLQLCSVSPAPVPHSHGPVPVPAVPLKPICCLLPCAGFGVRPALSAEGHQQPCACSLLTAFILPVCLAGCHCLPYHWAPF